MIGLQTAQPHIAILSNETKAKVQSLLEKYVPNQVFCSEFGRSEETAKLFTDTVIVAPQLNEIQFSMSDFSSVDELSGDELEPERINTIRYNFSCALLNDTLKEKQKDIIDRVTGFISTLRAIKTDTTILCCSHGFIMKLYEHFFRYGDQLYDFEHIVRGYDWRKPPFGFLDGFVVEIDRMRNKKIVGLL